MTTKCCTHCKEHKPLDDYHKHSRTKDKRDTLCRECRKIKDKVKYILNSAFVLESKYKPCNCCGKISNPFDMDLHHIDPTTKEHNVANMLHFSRAKIAKEIDKCVPVCKSCHREIHRGNRRSG